MILVPAAVCRAKRVKSAAAAQNNGDYNGIACAADLVVAAWASATPPLGVAAPSPGINIYADVITLPWRS